MNILWEQSFFDSLNSLWVYVYVFCVDFEPQKVYFHCIKQALTDLEMKIIMLQCSEHLLYMLFMIWLIFAKNQNII